MQKKIKIIIIDDEESIRDSLKWHFEGLGHDVRAAEYPTVCSAYYQEQCVAKDPCADVIFIDQNMPSMTGTDFLKMQEVRGCKLSASCKYIMTGVVTDDVKNATDSLGCQIVQKPFSLVDAEAFVLKAKTVK